jgi:hypothetical protein
MSDRQRARTAISDRNECERERTDHVQLVADDDERRDGI